MKSPDPSELLGEEDENAIQVTRLRLYRALEALDTKCEAIQKELLPGDPAELVKLGKDAGSAVTVLINERARVGKLGDRFGYAQTAPAIDFDAVRDKVRGALDNIRASKEAE